MISESKTIFSFNFRLKDELVGEVNYNLTQIGNSEIDALKRLRTNMAVIIQDINEKLGQGAKVENKSKS